MQVEAELAKLSSDRDTVLTIGVFDGVHLGHKHLLSQLKEQAGREDLLSGVVTFSQHPQAVLLPQTKQPYLTDLDRRIKLLKAEGIDVVVTLSFTGELAQLSPRQFIGLLQKYMRMRGLVIGPDFALGQNREGDTEALRALGEDMGFSVTVISPLVVNRGVVSSTAIRQALAEGDMSRVHDLTGRTFSLHGRVIPGVGRGKGLGFPTANLEINTEQAIPADGVYATWTYLADKAYPSMTNIGRRPTFNDGQRTVEVYLLDYQGDLYRHELRIDIMQRLRSEQRFDTADELKRQMTEDVQRGEKY